MIRFLSKMVSLTLSLAALSAVTPFYVPATSPLLFFFPIFLFQAAQSPRLNMYPILLWATISSIFEWVPVADALIYLAPNQTYRALIPSLLLIIYTTLYTAWWLQKTGQLLANKPLKKQLIIWTIALWALLLFKIEAQFFIFGRIEGYPFANPLIPLSYYPWLVYPLCILPEWLALYWFVLIPCTAYWFIHERTGRSAFLLGAILVPWAFTPQRKECAPEWLASIGHLPIMIPSTASPLAGAALIAHELHLISERFPSVSTVILPESAWNGTQLSTSCRIPLWSTCQITDILIGSFFKETNQCYNTAFHYTAGIRSNTTNKRHALPLAERRIPLPFCADLYFEHSDPICCCPKPKTVSTLKKPSINAVIYICSELFFNRTPDDPYSCLIIAMVNDWWFNMNHFCWLMVYAARLKALQWQRPILYISYKHAVYIDCSGFFYYLMTSSYFDKKKKTNYL